MKKILLVLVLWCAQVSQAQHVDIEVGVENGRLVTDPRIGEGEFGEEPNPANVADEPGFDVEPGVFNPGETLSFNALNVLGQNLWFWDGMGDVNFGTSPHALTIEHPVTAQSISLNSAPGAVDLPGFLIGVADSEGGFHQDLEFILDVVSEGGPAPGVYLFGVELTSNAYDPSDPVYFVLASEVDESIHEAAIDWVAGTFNIPEPSAFALLALGLLGGLRCARR